MSEVDEGTPPVDIPQFHLAAVFPDPAAIFSFHLEPLEKIKDSCLVVPDTSVLLLPYTVSPNSLAEIGNTLRLVAQHDRLRIPAQVAREFAINRATKLTELYQQLSNKKSLLKQFSIGKYPLLDSLEDYQEALAAEKRIDDELSKYKKTLDKVMVQVRAWTWDDPVSVLYGELFTPETIAEPAISPTELEEDLKRRNTLRIPPGYKDAAKGTNTEGDLAIWHTIINLAHTYKKSTILISGDGKSDWCHRSMNFPLYPRFELVDEFRRASDGGSFYILKLSDFLDLFGAKESAVDEIRLREGEEGGSRTAQFGMLLENALIAWLVDKFPSSTVYSETDDFCDLNVQTASGSHLGVSIVTIDPLEQEFIRRIFRRVNSCLAVSPQFDNFILCVVGANKEHCEKLGDTIAQATPSGLSLEVSVGFLTKYRTYFEVVRFPRKIEEHHPIP